jgi:prevent-host-death family protein
MIPMAKLLSGIWRASIRELRQNLSQYVERVKRGETVEVTEHGRLVAALLPRVADEDALVALRRARRLGGTGASTLPGRDRVVSAEGWVPWIP